MLSILVFGTGAASENLMNIINHDNVNLLGFIDNNKEKQGCSFLNRIIISPENIKNYNFSYIVIASQFYEEIINQLLNLGIEQYKILNFFTIIREAFQAIDDKVWGEYCKHELKLQFDKLDLLCKETQVLITGISYAKFSLNESLLRKPAINFALPGQDLFYDYKIVEKVVSSYNVPNFKYAIIGLCYYSFDYDLSMSRKRDRCDYVYYPKLKDLHNYQDRSLSYSSMKSRLGFDNIIKDNFLEILNECYVDKFEKIDFNIYWNKSLSSLNLSNEEKEKQAAFVADLDAKKNYPNTVKENKDTLYKYLKLMKKLNIKPILVVLPTSKYYDKYFPKELKEKFYEIVNEFSKEFDFQFIDCFKLDFFHDNDFCDVFHLGKNGADKFTEYLNRKIIW